MKNNCKQCEADFESSKDDLDFYQKMEVPIPTLCPSCRMQRRMAFRNERSLYKRKCDFSGKDILAIYTPDCGYKIYEQKIWWSDKWDALDYGKDFDFDKTFFEQFDELMKEVPLINLQNRNNENSDYCNDTNDLKNCYLCFNAEQASNMYYLNTGGYGTDCVDNFWCMEVELCHECSKVIGGYHSFWCFDCSNISDCYFCEDLIGCKNCFGCVGLRQKEYYIYNKQFSRTDYENFISSFEFSYKKVEDAKKKSAELRLKIPRKALKITQSEDCLGDFISNSKNCKECFDVMNSENCKYIWDGILNNGQDCFNVGLDSEFLYECVGVYRSNNLKFCGKCTASSNATYCENCFQCHDCFGCVGIRHKKYCILNKQYTKEKYDELVPRIIEYMKTTGEYGDFFPAKLSPFGYNDSTAAWYFPIKREEAKLKGFNWNDHVGISMDLPSILASELPEKIDGVGSDIFEKAIVCQEDGKLFKIIPQELKFYQKYKIPLPRLCPDCRHERRKKLTNPRKLWTRKCHKCEIEIKTTYSPDRPDKIYCKKCYLDEVY